MECYKHKCILFYLPPFHINAGRVITTLLVELEALLGILLGLLFIQPNKLLGGGVNLYIN